MKIYLTAAWERRINTGLPVSELAPVITEAEKRTGQRAAKARNLKELIRFINKSINQN